MLVRHEVGAHQPFFGSLQSGSVKGRAQKKKKSCGFRVFEAHGAQRNTILLLVQLIVDFQFAAHGVITANNHESVIMDFRFFIFLSQNMYAFRQKHRDLRFRYHFSTRRVTAEAKACRRRSRPRSRWRWWWRDHKVNSRRNPKEDQFLGLSLANPATRT